MTTPTGLTIVLGGARSGKSALGVRRGIAHERAGGTVTFIATSPRIAGDDDLERRIAAHQAERPPSWRTCEEEVDLAGAISVAPPAALVIVDCLTLWVSNLLYADADDSTISAAAAAAIDVAQRRPGPTIAISNEVGLGIVPANELARHYRDVLGRVNQQFAAEASEAYLMVAGRALPLIDIDT